MVGKKSVWLGQSDLCDVTVQKHDPCDPVNADVPSAWRETVAQVTEKGMKMPDEKEME